MNPFWNSQEQRIRAFWRILIQGLLFLLGSAGPMILLVIVAVTVYGDHEQLQTRKDVEKWFKSDPALLFFTQLILLGTQLFSTWVAARFLDRRPFADLGLRCNRAWIPDLLFGFFIGAASMGLIFLAEWLMGWVRITETFYAARPQDSWAGAMFLGVLMFCAVALMEELQSRGYHFRNLAEGFNLGNRHPRAALIGAFILSSAVFGAIHAHNDNASLTSTLNVVLGGMMLCLGVLLTGELAIPLGIHFSWNFFQGYIFGFPVSGQSVPCSLIAIEQRGPEAWTGGAFGPEAGIVGIAAILLQAVLILVWVRCRRGSLSIHTDWAVYHF